VRKASDIDRAMGWYRSRDKATHPGSEASHKLRAEISPHLHTSAAEAAWRRAEGLPEGQAFHVDYLGIFDTVGAHGVPGVLGQFRAVPGGHGFHDHELSRSVLAGRHAVALDETRMLYRPTLWSNFDKLTEISRMRGDAELAYQQLWFPGSHGKLGGSGAERALSNAALAWIVDGAERSGLRIDLPESLRPEPDAYLGSLHNEAAGFDPTGLLRWVRRGPGAGEMEALHATARARLATRSDYRPGSLRKMLLDGGSLAAVKRVEAGRVG
jgi:uncharacterized protein (DUF2235 family)